MSNRIQPLGEKESNITRDVETLHFYIITLFESSERMENASRMAEKLRAHGYNVEIIKAYYYKSFDVIKYLYDEGVEYTSKDKSLSLTQVGCFLSHRTVWKKIAAGNPKDVHIILEDDLTFEGDLFNFNEIPEYDAVILWRHPAQINTPVTYVKEGLLNFYNQWGTQSYALTPQFASTLVTGIRQIECPVDILLYRDYYPHNRVYILEKSSFINLGELGTADSTHVFKSTISTF